MLKDCQIEIAVANVCNAWDKTFGGIKDDSAGSIQQTTDGGYIVAGRTESKGVGGLDAWIFKLDQNGNLDCK